MRIAVRWPSEAYGELRADLERLPPRARAERLRVLASIGLAFLGAGRIETSAAPGSEGAGSRPAEPEGAERFKALRQRLKGSVD
jgi:hypothetical protein